MSHPVCQIQNVLSKKKATMKYRRKIIHFYDSVIIILFTVSRCYRASAENDINHNLCRSFWLPFENTTAIKLGDEASKQHNHL